MLPRMRTRDKCMEMLRKDDPDTVLTRSSLDYLIRDGKIPYVDVGNRILINYDRLLEYLYKGTSEPVDEPAETTPGTIRRVEI